MLKGKKDSMTSETAFVAKVYLQIILARRTMTHNSHLFIIIINFCDCSKILRLSTEDWMKPVSTTTEASCAVGLLYTARTSTSYEVIACLGSLGRVLVQWLTSFVLIAHECDAKYIYRSL